MKEGTLIHKLLSALPGRLHSTHPASPPPGVTISKALFSKCTASSLQPFWTNSNHGDVGHAALAERGDLWLVVELEHCRLLKQTAAESHKLSLYLGHWDAPAARSRQDTIMQEEG